MKTLSLILLLLVPSIALAGEAAETAPGIESGRSLLGIYEKEGTDVGVAFLIDLSARILYTRTSGFRFRTLHVTDNEICIQLKARNPDEVAEPSCFKKLKSGDYSASGFLVGKFAKEVRYMDATVINKENYDALLKGSRWSLSSVNNCTTDMMKFNTDGTIYSRFDTPDGPYSYNAKLDFIKNNIVEESGRDSEGGEVANRYRLFIVKKSGRLYYQEIAYFDRKFDAWLDGSGGDAYSRCKP